MATKVRQAVVMSTPQRSAKQRSVYSEADKKSLLDNFDLEVGDKTRAFKASLAAMLSSFALRQEAEILKLPRELRSMKLGDLENKWAGSWKETVQKMLQDKIEERERAEKAERERAAEEEMKLKRKRAEEAAEGSPGRNSKNARRDPGTAKKVVPGSTSKRRHHNTKTPRSKPSGGGSTNAGPSTLPQDHVFNPRLPPTPSFPRQAKRNESFFSANGSPILIPYTGSSPSAAHSDAEVNEGTDHRTQSDDEDLPDPALLEAQILAQASAQSPKSKSSHTRKPKRGPSLVFRKSMAAAPAVPDEDGAEYSTIPLSDGRVITFNPFELRPDQVELELNKGGLDRKEKNSVMQQVREEAHKALTARMERWKVS